MNEDKMRTLLTQFMVICIIAIVVTVIIAFISVRLVIDSLAYYIGLNFSLFGSIGYASYHFRKEMKKEISDETVT